MELIRERAYQRWDLQVKGLIRDGAYKREGQDGAFKREGLLDGAYKGEDLSEMGLITERAYQRWGL